MRATGRSRQRQGQAIAVEEEFRHKGQRRSCGRGHKGGERTRAPAADAERTEGALQALVRNGLRAPCHCTAGGALVLTRVTHLLGQQGRGCQGILTDNQTGQRGSASCVRHQTNADARPCDAIDGHQAIAVCIDGQDRGITEKSRLDRGKAADVRDAPSTNLHIARRQVLVHPHGSARNRRQRLRVVHLDHQLLADVRAEIRHGTLLKGRSDRQGRVPRAVAQHQLKAHRRVKQTGRLGTQATHRSRQEQAAVIRTQHAFIGFVAQGIHHDARRGNRFAATANHAHIALIRTEGAALGAACAKAHQSRSCQVERDRLTPQAVKVRIHRLDRRLIGTAAHGEGEIHGAFLDARCDRGRARQQIEVRRRQHEGGVRLAHEHIAVERHERRARLHSGVAAVDVDRKTIPCDRIRTQHRQSQIRGSCKRLDPDRIHATTVVVDVRLRRRRHARGLKIQRERGQLIAFLVAHRLAAGREHHGHIAAGAQRTRHTVVIDAAPAPHARVLLNASQRSGDGLGVELRRHAVDRHDP